jgi:hypothetical protein
VTRFALAAVFRVLKPHRCGPRAELRKRFFAAQRRQPGRSTACSLGPSFVKLGQSFEYTYGCLPKTYTDSHYH